MTNTAIIKSSITTLIPPTMTTFVIFEIFEVLFILIRRTTQINIYKNHSFKFYININTFFRF